MFLAENYRRRRMEWKYRTTTQTAVFYPLQCMFYTISSTTQHEIIIMNETMRIYCMKMVFKDSAYYCYCTNVLRISRYLGFLWVVPTNTGIFLCGLKLY